MRQHMTLSPRTGAGVASAPQFALRRLPRTQHRQEARQSACAWRVRIYGVGRMPTWRADMDESEKLTLSRREALAMVGRELQ